MKVWRIVNSIVLLIGFFSPLFRIETDLWSPGELYEIETSGAIAVVQGLLPLPYQDQLSESAGQVALMLLAFAIVNLIFAWLKTPPKTWVYPPTILLGISVIGIVLLLLGDYDLLWGYWLFWVGIVSSIAFEVQYYKSRPPITEQDVAS